jgi:hypothetical protein
LREVKEEELEGDGLTLLTGVNTLNRHGNHALTPPEMRGKSPKNMIRRFDRLGYGVLRNYGYRATKNQLNGM